MKAQPEIIWIEDLTIKDKMDWKYVGAHTL
jgi:hypothetical protein